MRYKVGTLWALLLPAAGAQPPTYHLQVDRTELRSMWQS